MAQSALGRALLTLSLIILLGSIALAATNVGGQISADTTWTTAGSPYIVLSDVQVYSTTGNTPVLTIQAGAVVKFNAGTGLYIGSGTYPGKLTALGTSTTKITFTANGSTARGFWNGIFFDDGADNTSLLQYANVYNGGGGNPGDITVNTCNVTVNNCTIRFSSTCGIYLQNAAAPVMGSNAVTYCTQYPLSFDPGCRVASVTSITGGTTNGTNMVEVRPGDISGSNDTWRKLSIPYHVTDRVMVYGTTSTSVKLTIAAGATLKFAPAGHLVIGNWDEPACMAILDAVGTPTNIIQFTSAQATPAPDDWPGLILLDGVVDASTRIEYATVEYAGLSTGAAISLHSCSPYVRNSVTIRYSSDRGLLMNESAATVNGVTFANNAGYAIRIDGAAGRASKLSNLTFSANGKDAVEYARGEIREASETLPYLGTSSVYELPDGLNIFGESSTAATLTVAAGSTLRFLNGQSLHVGGDDPAQPGQLVATGTSPLPIVMEGTDPVAGSWGGFGMDNYATATLDYVTIRYAATGVRLNNASPTITNSTIQNSSDLGLLMYFSAAPTISACTIRDGATYPIQALDGARMAGLSNIACVDNATNTVHYYGGGEMGGTGDTLPNLGVPYEVESSINVRGQAGETPLLRLLPGVEMRFSDNEGITIGNGDDIPGGAGHGALEAIGTSDEPILLRSRAMEPSRWNGVYLDNGTIDASTHLSYVTIAEAGQNGTALYFSGCSPAIDNLTINGSAQYGITLWESAPTVSTAAVTGAATAPILASPNCRLKNFSNITFDPGAFIDYSGGRFQGESETLPGFSVPYRVSGWLEIYGDLETAMSLTIGAGARLEFMPATGIIVGSWENPYQGILVSAGTSSQGVVLTGYDSGPWEWITFLDGSVDGATRFDYTTIDLAGAGGNRAVFVQDCSPIFSNCLITHSPGYGIWVDHNSALQVSDSTFDSNGGYPISIDMSTTASGITNNTFVNNNPDAIEHRGGEVTGDVRLAYTGQPWIINGHITVRGTTDTPATLTVDPGVVIKFNGTFGITVGLPTGEKGVLIADGTESLPIVFTTNLTPEPGAWHGFELYTASPASSLKYCTIEYAGNGNEKSLELIGGAVSLEHCALRNGLGTGLTLHDAGASGTLTDCTIDAFSSQGIDIGSSATLSYTGGTVSNCPTRAIYIGAASPTISNLTITACGTAAIRAGVESRLKNISSLTLDPSAYIEYQAGRIQGEDEAFPGVAMRLSGNLQVAGTTEQTTALSIAAGASLRFPSGASFAIGMVSGERGALNCLGTAVAPILLESIDGTPGSWVGLELNTAPTACQLAYTTIAHAGQSYNRSVYALNAPTSFSYCTISNGVGYGAYIAGGTPSFTDCSFLYNTGYPLSLDINANATLARNTFTGNNPDAVEYRGGVLTADRRITNSGAPYNINGSIEVKGAGTPVTLTIDPGVVLRFASGQKLVVGGTTAEPGALVAVGTIDQPIVLTGQTQVRGAWGGAEINDGAIDGTTQLAFCRIEYGGNSGLKVSSALPVIQDSRVTQSSGVGIWVFSSPLQLARVTADANNGTGIRVDGGTVVLDACTVSANDWGVSTSSSVSASGCAVTSNRSGGIYISSVSPSYIANSTVSSNPTGILANGGTAAIVNTVFSHNTAYPITLGGSASLAGSSSLTFDSNGHDAIQHQGGSSTVTTILVSLGVPYHVTGDLTVSGGAFSIEAGCVLEFGAGRRLSVTNGSLRSLGSQASPVRFRALGSTTPGSWAGIYLGQNADASQMLLSDLIVEYATTGVEVDRLAQALAISDCQVLSAATAGISATTAGSLSLDGVTVTDAQGRGINQQGGHLSVHQCTVSGAGAEAIYVNAGILGMSDCVVQQSPRGIYVTGGETSCTVTLDGVTVSNIAESPVSMDARTGLTGDSSFTLTGNTNNAVEHRGGYAYSPVAFYDFGYPYIFTGSFSCYSALTLSAGVVLKFDQGQSFSADSVQAPGTAARPILLTANSATPSPGFWSGFWIDGHESASLLEYVTIEYADYGLYSSSATTARNCTARFNSTRGVGGIGQIIDTQITENTGIGLDLSRNGPAVVTGCTISNNGGNGIFVSTYGTKIIEQCSVTGNGGVGVKITYATPSIRHCVINGNAQGGALYTVSYQNQKNQDLRYNYWGDATGPGGVGPGSGDSVNSTYVIFEPWLESPNNADFEITRCGATNREIPDGQGQVYISAEASAGADWTFEVLTSLGEVRYSYVQTGKIFLHSWAGLDSSGQHLAAGTYRWRLAASVEGDPLSGAAPMTGTLGIVTGLPTVCIDQPIEQSDVSEIFEVYGSVQGTQGNWVLYGGQGEGWLASISSLTQLASGSGPFQRSLLKQVNLDRAARGYFVYVLRATNASKTAEQRISVEKGPLSVQPNPFTPNGDGINDTILFSGDYQYDAWQLTFRSPGGDTVRSLSGITTPLAIVWDGRNDAGEVVQQGIYSYRLLLTDGASVVEDTSGLVQVEQVAAEVTVSVPDATPDAVKIPVVIHGSVTLAFDQSFTWQLEIGAGSAPTTWELVASGAGTTSISDQALATWMPDVHPPDPPPNGPYSIRLTITTSTGEVVSQAIQVQMVNFWLLAGGPFYPQIGETGLMQVYVAFDSNITVDLYRLGGSGDPPVLARRLADQQGYTTGWQNLTWDGKDQTGNLVPDGMYCPQVRIFQGQTETGRMGDCERPLVSQVGPGFVGTAPPPNGIGYRPFYDPTVYLQYDVQYPGAVDFIEHRRDGTWGRVVAKSAYHLPGTHGISWDLSSERQIDYEVDKVYLREQVYEDDPQGVERRILFMVYGTSPSVTHVTIWKPFVNGAEFGDAGMEIYFNLDRRADVTIELVQFESGAVLHTWALPDQGPGSNLFSWDGTLEDGTRPFNGNYQWRITATANGYTSAPNTALMRIIY